MYNFSGGAHMYVVNKISSFSAVDYAAEELRKYLRMMMPECGNIDIKYDPEAKDGFRLGLMQDFGLDISDAEEPDLDDILYIDCDDKGGIIAGDNPRSVLLAVYEYLRQNGCRWLMPGVDGEFIPMQDIVAVKYRHKPSCRYRGQCNEGAEYQSDMMDAIEFTPKVGMNVFMLEFFVPAGYYRQYYNHKHNEMNRNPEPVSENQILQWKRQCESEINKRGLMFHDIGHGWTCKPFGINTAMKSGDQAQQDLNNASLTDKQKSYLALVNGERKLWKGYPNWTQFCMSNEEGRHRVAEYVAEYAESHSNSDYIHVWLADFVNNHCECEECRKMMPWDWYITLLNEIDEEMTARGLGSKVVFACYTEMLYVSDKVKLKNPDRFSLLVAPISRSYYEAIPEKPKHIEPAPYTLNKLIMPPDIDTYLLQTRRQVETYKVTNTMVYEYHFCFNQYFNPGNMDYARMLYKDVKAYKINGMKGIIQDGTQRNYYPNTFLLYVYAETLFDTSVDFDTMVEDYYSHAYGEVWRDVVELFERIG